MSRVLLIAGESFLGKHVHALLEKRGHDVLATCRSGSLLPCDLCDAVEVQSVVGETEPHWIINCAGVTNGNAADMQRIHVEGTRHLLHAVARHAPRATVLLFGSAAEYGNVVDADLPIREKQTCRPLSAYGGSKLAQTGLARDLAARLRLRVLIARPFNIIGPGMSEGRMPMALARSALACAAGSVLTVANAAATRDWIDVRDVAGAVAALLRDDVATPGHARVFNIATGVETPVLTVADELCRFVGQACALPDGRPVTGISRSVGDVERIRRATGWIPRISWRRSVVELCRDLRFLSAVS